LWEAWARPQEGDTATAFTFEVLYKDEDGDEPEYVTLRLDEEEHPMEPDGEGPQDSTWYRVTLPALEAGLHTYSYKASDGEDAVDTDWRDGPEVVQPPPPNQAPVLWEAWARPQEGDTATAFTFEVLYKDEDGDEPEYVTLRLDEEEHPMEPDGEGPQDSTWYRVTLPALEAGLHTYSYKASDGETDIDTDWQELHVLHVDPPVETFDFEGVVKFIELEGGFHGIVREGAVGLLPFNLPTELAEDGLRVKGEGHELEVTTIQQWGIPIEIENIEVIDDDPTPEPEPGTETKEGGEIEGVLVAKGKHNDSIEVRLDGDEGVKKYVPHWIGGSPSDGGGLDNAIIQQIAELYIGNRVLVHWEHDERLRVVSVEQFEPEINEGVIEGIVVDKSDGWIEIQSLDNGLVERYSPVWSGGLPKEGGGLDKDILIAISRAELGGEVRVEWSYDERKRVIDLSGDGIKEPEEAEEEEEVTDLPEWLEQSISKALTEDQQPRFGSVTGIVRDAEDNIVAGAEVTAQTPDGLLWLETKTNAEGRFEFDHLVPREWSFVAFPASDEGIARESEPLQLPIGKGEAESIALQLGQANVYGRVLAERPDGTHKPLDDASVWIFPDRDGDGHPDPLIGDTSAGQSGSTYTHPEDYYLHSDRRGYFSFNLPPGSYSLLVELPLGTGLAEPEAITFDLDEGSDPIRLGNDEIEGVTFVLVKAPAQVIIGRVLDQEGAPASNALVAAWTVNGNGWAETEVEIDGSYELKLGSGKWEVLPHPPFDLPVDWSYDKDPEMVQLSAQNPERKIDFTVYRRSSATGIKGRLLKPDGSSDWTVEQTEEISIEAWNPEGIGNWAQIDTSGNFELALDPGHYETHVWASPAFGYIPPDIGDVQVSPEEPVDLGDLSFTQLSSKITGTIISSEDNEPLANLYVYAWNDDGGYASTVTDTGGNYSLSVGPGFWRVAYEPPLGENDTGSHYKSTRPVGVKVEDDQVVERIDFKVVRISSLLEGRLVGIDGEPIGDVAAAVYARTAEQGDDWFDVVAEASVDGRGHFQLRLPEGEFLLGAWLAPDATYEIKEEVRVTDATSSTTLVLVKDDAVISGSLTLDDEPVTGLSGDVFAVPSNGDAGWRVASIEEDGSYHLQVGAGEWLIEYQVSDWPIQLPPFQPFPDKPLVASVEAGSETILDLALHSLAGIVTGTIVDSEGKVVDGDVSVWIERIAGADEWFELETWAIDGSFSLSIPNGSKYAVGAYIGPAVREAGHLEPEVVFADLRKQDNAEVTLTLGRRAEDEVIAGNVVDEDNSAVAGSFVYAWSEGGRFAEAESDANGSFALPVTSGDIWHVGAESVLESENDQVPYATDDETRVDLREKRSVEGILLTLAKPEFVVPDGIVESFDPREDFTAALPDGTKITIAANSLPVGDEETLVRLVAQPVIQGLVKNVNDRPLDYAYSIELFDSSGKEIAQKFNQAVTIAIEYDEDDLERWGTNDDDLSISFFSSTKNAWEDAGVSTVDEQSGTIYARVDHFSQWAPTASPDVTPGGPVPSALSESAGVTDLSHGWSQVSWFGAFHDSGDGWIYHEKHGWLFVSASSDDNFWFYDEAFGWLWTGPSYYGTSSGGNFVYSNSERSWLHYNATADGERWFYLYSGGYWKSASGKSQVSVAADVSPVGSGTVSGAGTHTLGDIAQLTATPSPGYQFTGWSGEGVSATSPTISVTVNGAKKVQANFVRVSVAEIIDALFD